MNAQEWAYDTKKKMKEEEQIAEQKKSEDIQIDIDTTPTEEAPASQPVETKSTDQNQDAPQPKEVQILAQGTVVMKTY